MECRRVNLNGRVAASQRRSRVDQSILFRRSEGKQKRPQIGRADERKLLFHVRRRFWAAQVEGADGGLRAVAGLGELMIGRGACV